MDMLHTLWYYLPVVVALYVFIQHTLHKLKNYPPTPFLGLPLIGHYYLMRKDLQTTFSKLSHHYGPIFSLLLGSRRVLVVSSASAAEECLTKNNDIVFANRPDILLGKHFGYNHTSIVWGPYGDHWRNLRRIASIELLSVHRSQRLSQVRAEEVQTLLRQLFQNSVENMDQPLAMKLAFFEFMINLLTRMIGGKRYYGKHASESDEAKRFQQMVSDTSKLAGSSSLGKFTPILHWLVFNLIEKRFVDVQKKKDDLTQKWIYELRIAGSNGSIGLGEKSVIEILLSLQAKEPEYYSDDVIKSLMLALLQAGVSTSVDTMEWVMTLLLNSPEVLKTARKEIDNRVGQNRLINEVDVAELPYLECIIKETMRMHPVVPFLVPHESSAECSVGGFHVPRETSLLVNVRAIQNDPNNWEDPEIFRPERFLGLDGVKVGCKWMPFGSGRRKCPGEGLAMRVMSLALGSLIQCFEWDHVGKEMENTTGGMGLTEPKAQPLMVMCRPRPTMVKLLSAISI